MNIKQSEDLFKKACELMPGGVNSPVRAFKAVGGSPIFIKKASGARVWDVDGNEYIDYVASWGPLIFGHAHPKIVEALKMCKCNILLKGTKTLICSPTGNIVLNNHASSELAVIGSGDVLCGIIASLVGKNKLTPFLACCAAVWIHGDIAKKFGPGLIAEDIVKNIPNILKKLKKRK